MSHAWIQRGIRGITDIETDGIVSGTINKQPNNGLSKEAYSNKIDWYKIYTQGRVIENIQKRLTDDKGNKQTEL